MNGRNVISIDLSGYSYDALIFDCDGTLVNTAPLHYEAFRLALLDQGAIFDKKWYESRLGLSRFELLSEFAQHTEQPLDVNVAVDSSQLHFLTLTDQIEVIPEIADIVLTHWKITPMAVASSGQRLSVVTSLQKAGLIEKFDAIVTAEDVIAHKPEPDPYLKAADKLDVNPDRCLVFEDTDEGLESASRAGARSIDVRTIASIYKI